jgi:hypothetical protein
VAVPPGRHGGVPPLLPGTYLLEDHATALADVAAASVIEAVLVSGRE